MTLNNSNLQTHYLRIHNPTDNSFSFTTESGIKYKAYFLEAFDYFPNKAFSSNLFLFGFEVVSESLAHKEKKAYDERVKNTITKTIADFIEYDKNRIVIYVCDPKDEKEVHRSRLFNKWYVSLSGETTIIKIDDVLEESVYISALLSRENPLKNEFADSFYELKDRLDK